MVGFPYQADPNLEPQSEGAVQIGSGDYILADLNGVVHIPEHLVEEVIRLIPSQVDADGKIAADLAKGRSFTEASEEHRRNVKKPEDSNIPESIQRQRVEALRLDDEQ